VHYLLANSAFEFPPVSQTDEDGILAVGGDLQPGRLIEAYRRGIFPWYSDGLPILWHCPNPRFVLVPEKLHVPKSLKKQMARGHYEVKFDSNFAAVIDGCAQTKRAGQRGTWITRDMRKAYLALHELGYAHSAETYLNGTLVGGLYGVSLGLVFFGESMFSKADDASKVAFIALVEWMISWGVALIDCQQETEHLRRFGAELWPREKFVSRLGSLTGQPGRVGQWKNISKTREPVHE
jgi:leucyl/phenylalanyl-tRNA---protein transferase